MDARTGRELRSQNADTRLHPASLTKMMTLYMAFTAIERGQVRLDTKFQVSTHAANQQPSKLGLRPGQTIELRYLIRAAAVKSANDAAVVIAEGLAGSEAQFGAQMTGMAQALGMRNTQFRNASGLTAQGHFSTARDLTILGRRLFYDFPQYYSIFSRRSADAGVATVSSTNRRFLDSYQGADGIKTGYTRAAGFNLTASAHRGSKRIIATVMGGQSTAHRNAIMAQLLDAGFAGAPSRVREVRPEPQQYMAQQKVVRQVQVERQAPAPVQPVTLASSAAPPAAGPARRASLASGNALDDALAQARAQAPAAQPATPGVRLTASARPQRRPGSASTPVAPAPVVAGTDAARPPRQETTAASANAPVASDNGLARSTRPVQAPRDRQSANMQADNSALGTELAAAGVATSGSLFAAAAVDTGGPERLSLAASPAPARRAKTVILASLAAPEEPAATQIVSRVATGGKRQNGVLLGRFTTQAAADRVLVQAALQESDMLADARRWVNNAPRGWEAHFTGMSRASAVATCDRLQARQQECQVTGP
ncbi:MAG: D-alanyl-D-alanine carboxypeptidase family protein [Paracoccus sp. (in: a-proteobacteria)]|uniref:D-alanyl-D-alanine carboxypeptidase family protein n=1 Tax=Paracoccus sp. TaxID=267 RepID=UPI0026DFE4A5|nr:D-alanyl-D-alanine carboxypeptidase family protein [Paracoccus sp. (in: a-proteobacteria)]MDO5620590.1 D-alanyl-D-alanine carboxypeptidase family protein [Paracoccus sp. (in: a-proteobacteria)]